jgi:hypothetical protein
MQKTDAARTLLNPEACAAALPGATQSRLIRRAKFLV